VSHHDRPPGTCNGLPLPRHRLAGASHRARPRRGDNSVHGHGPAADQLASGDGLPVDRSEDALVDGLVVDDAADLEPDDVTVDCSRLGDERRYDLVLRERVGRGAFTAESLGGEVAAYAEPADRDDAE